MDSQEAAAPGVLSPESENVKPCDGSPVTVMVATQRACKIMRTWSCIARYGENVLRWKVKQCNVGNSWLWKTVGENTTINISNVNNL